ncbi:DUF397 domain-containing protein [Spirillospora sp. NPDC052269]
MDTWRRSSYSESGAGGSCIELADLGEAVGVRDSKAPDAGHLTLRRADLLRLTEAIRRSVA